MKFSQKAFGALAIALTLSATACTSSEPAAMKKDAAAKLSVTYVQGITGNSFFTSVTCGAAEEAKALGVDFNFQGGSDYSAVSQTPVLNAVIAKKPSGIIISPMAGDAMVPPLKEAKKAGIKLVFVDSTAADDTLAEAFTTSDNEKGGALAAQKIAEGLGDKGTVIVMGATAGISTTDARQKGFENEIKNHPGITLLPTEFSESKPATANSKLSAIIASHPELNAVFAVSTQEVEGVATAVKAAGLTGKLKIVGFDTSDPIIEDIKSGLVEGLVVQQPLEMGKIAVQQMVKALKGEATEKLINTEFVFLTKDNLEDPNVNKYIYKSSC